MPGVKALLDSCGFYGGPSRLPLMNLSEEDLSNLKLLFEQNGFNSISKNEFKHISINNN